MKLYLNIRFIILILASVLSQAYLFAQQLILPEQCPEKIQFYTDRQLYITGEALWFSAACLSADAQNEETISKVLYIEILNAQNRVFVQQKMVLEHGLVSGRIYIPEELPTAAYFIRAYTQLMRNYPPENYFHAQINIINPEFPPLLEQENDSLQISLDQKNLIPGYLNRVTLKFKSHWQSADIYEIVDSSGFIHQSFKVFKNGFASTSFRPSDSGVYAIRRIRPAVDTALFPLPAVSNQPFINCNLQPKNLEINLTGFETFFRDGGIKLDIVSQTGLLLASHPVEANSKNYQVPESKLENGLIYVCIYDANDNLVKMKTIFYQNPLTYTLPVEVGKDKFGQREKVDFTVDAAGLKTDPPLLIQTSVLHAGSSSQENTIPVNLLLNPGLWRDASINSADSMIAEQLSAALVIYNHQIRQRFEKRKQQQPVEMYFVPDIRDISITGTVVDAHTQNPLSDKSVYATVLHEDFQIHATQTNSEGRFVFSFPHLTGDHDIFLRAGSSDSITAQILLNNDFSTQFIELFDHPLYLNKSQRAHINDLLLNQQVSMVYNSADRAIKNDVPPIPSWFGEQAKTIKLSDYIALQTVREVINEIVNYTRLRERNGQYQIVIFDEQSELTYEDPLVLLDGIPIMDARLLLDLYPAQIEKIDVINRTFILGDLTVRGLLYIHTKTDNFGGINLPEDVVFLNYQMRTESADFKQPETADLENLAHNTPWFQTLLLYSNSSKTDFTNQTFITSDQSGKYQIQIRGITKAGKSINGAQNISISKNNNAEN